MDGLGIWFCIVQRNLLKYGGRLHMKYYQITSEMTPGKTGNMCAQFYCGSIERYWGNNETAQQNCIGAKPGRN